MRNRSLCVVCCALLLPACAISADEKRASAEDGRHMICVPSEDGRRFDCGTRANPPPDRQLPSSVATSRAVAPPPFLAAPASAPNPGVAAPSSRPRTDEFPDAQDRDGPAAAPADESTARNVAESSSPPPAAREVEQPDATPPPMLAAPRARLSPYAPVDNGAPRTGSQSREAATVSAIADPEAAPAAPLDAAADPLPAAVDAGVERAAQPASEATGSVADTASIADDTQAAAPAAPELAPSAPVLQLPDLLDGNRFMQLQPDRYSVQIARADSEQGLRVVAEQWQLGAIGEQLYALRIQAGAQEQWLLMWSDVADATTGRAAWDALAADGVARPAAYPRRIGPLQDELRRAR